MIIHDVRRLQTLGGNPYAAISAAREVVEVSSGVGGREVTLQRLWPRDREIKCKGSSEPATFCPTCE